VRFWCGLGTFKCFSRAGVVNGNIIQDPSRKGNSEVESASKEKMLKREGLLNSEIGWVYGGRSFFFYVEVNELDIKYYK